MKRDIQHKFKRYRYRWYDRSMPGSWYTTSAANIEELLAQMLNDLALQNLISWTLKGNKLSLLIRFGPDHIRSSQYEIYEIDE